MCVCDSMASKSRGKEQLTLKTASISSHKGKTAKCKTPVKSIMSGLDRQKSRSSMKKIKVVLLLKLCY